MKFEDLVATVTDQPVFRSSLLLSGDRDPADVRRQWGSETSWGAADAILRIKRSAGESYRY